MASRFITPEALVEALHNRDDRARAQLQDWLGDPVRLLMQELHTRHRLEHRLDRLTRYSLHAAETYLRTRPAADFHAMSLAAFRATVLFHIGRQVVHPFGRQGTLGSVTPAPLPATDAYSFETVFLPLEKVGSNWFGGDWYGGRRETDGTFWLIVADITGHGYAAYLLANALPEVWRRCWEGRPASPQPGDVLAAMHDLLKECLPEDVYVESTLLRLDPSGRVTVAPAGGSRLLLRRHKKGGLDLLKLRGVWLGFQQPLTADQRTYVLEPGDELLLGTDGVFDQLTEFHGPGGDLTRLISDALDRGSLLDAVRDVLKQALRVRPQRDDITAITVRRLPNPETNGA